MTPVYNIVLYCNVVAIVIATSLLKGTVNGCTVKNPKDIVTPSWLNELKASELETKTLKGKLHE